MRIKPHGDQFSHCGRIFESGKHLVKKNVTKLIAKVLQNILVRCSCKMNLSTDDKSCHKQGKSKEKTYYSSIKHTFIAESIQFL